MRDQAKRTYEDVRLERAQLARERVRLEQQHAACASRAGTAALTPTQLQGLRERLAALSPLSLDNLEAHFRVVERGLAEQLAESQGRDSRLSAQLLDCFRKYCQQWPEDSGDFTVSLASADDFLARLDRLESDGLPRHEHRFFDLLQTQSKNNLLALQRHTAEAHKGIKQRMDEVNASLEQVPFNRGTLLTIEVSDRRLGEVQEFQQQLRAVLSHQQTEDRALAEAQFSTLRALVARLGAQEPDARRWREQVLDVRQHVEFIGVELDAQTRAQVEIYRSGAGKSGGQRQKLATTCLAAALRYQLGGEDGELPRYCAVVLDEAFDKADNEFTALAMNIFENFGFQMVVATPLKSVMTLEPFIGGACFVEISGRHNSGVLLIEYDEQAQRLQLPERSRGDEAAAAVTEQAVSAAQREDAPRSTQGETRMDSTGPVSGAEGAALQDVPAQDDVAAKASRRASKVAPASTPAVQAAPKPSKTAAASARAGSGTSAAAKPAAGKAASVKTAPAKPASARRASPAAGTARKPATPTKPAKTPANTGTASRRATASVKPTARPNKAATTAAAPKKPAAKSTVATRRATTSLGGATKATKTTAARSGQARTNQARANQTAAKARPASTRGSAGKPRGKR